MGEISFSLPILNFQLVLYLKLIENSKFQFSFFEFPFFFSHPFSVLFKLKTTSDSALDKLIY